jgi:chromosome segregation ATPase
MEAVVASQTRLHEVDQTYRLRERRCASQVKRLTTELAQVRDELWRNEQDMNKLRDEADTAAQNHADKISAMGAELAAAKNAADILRTGLAGREVRVTQLEKELTAVKVTAGKEMARAEALAIENKRLQAFEEQSVLVTEQHEAALKEARKQHEAAMAALTAKLETANAALTSADVSKNAALALNKLSDTSRDQLLKERDELKTKLDAVAADLELKLTDIGDLGKRVEQLEAELATRDKQLEDMHAQIERQRDAAIDTAAAVAKAALPAVVVVAAVEEDKGKKRKAATADAPQPVSSSSATAKKSNGSTAPAPKPAAAATSHKPATATAGSLAQHAFAADCGDE